MPDPVMYGATLLIAEPGRRLTKRYHDPNKKPDDYDGGWLYSAIPFECDSFEAFVEVLTDLPPDTCLIRGGVRADALADVEAGAHVRRLEYDRVTKGELECPAAFEPVPRSWIMLDYDDTASPFDQADVEGSITRWRATLPKEIRNAKSAFFLSASSHRSETVRGKLLVALRGDAGNASTECWAKANGADGSVCRTVQPNYLAPPIFEGCADPLQDHRSPVHFRGSRARLPLQAVEVSDAGLGDRRAAPAISDIPPLSQRGERLLTEAFVNRWLEGDRVASNAALHLFGWLLGKGWSKGEIGAVLDVLDSFEDDLKKVREHWHILGNARALEGPGAAQEWLGDHFHEVDAAANWSPQWEAIEARRAEATKPKPSDPFVDPWRNFTDFESERKPIDYFCEGLRLAPSKGKISIIAGQPGGGKGPIANHLAVAFAFGEKAFGQHPCKEKRVLLLDLEGRDLTRERLERMALALGHDASEIKGRIYHLDVSTKNLCEVESLMQIERIVETHGVEVVILDSYTSAMLSSGVDSNSPQFAQLAQLLGRLGVLVLAVAHANKAAAQRGEPRLSDIAYSGAFAALAQTALVVHYPDESDKDEIRISCARAPHKSFAPFDIRFTDGDDGSLRVTIATGCAPRATKDLKELKAKLSTTARHCDQIEAFLRSVDLEGHGMRAQKIYGTLKLSGASWAAAREELLRRGTVVEASLPTDRYCTYRLRN